MMSAIPRPEHPNPQKQRSTWLNLNGPWDFAESGDVTRDEHFLSPRAEYPLSILVPFPREAKASGLGRTDLVKNVWYRRTFKTPQDWRAPRTILHIGAADWKTRVWVNGALIGQHEGGNTPIALDATHVLAPAGGENTIIVHCFDDTTGGLQPLGKQSPTGKSHGIFYTPVTGIWQTVWLEGVGTTFIANFRLQTVVKEGRLFADVDLDGPAEGFELEAVATDEAGSEVARARAAAHWRNGQLVLEIPQPKLWNVGDPYLYGLTLRLQNRDGSIVDEVASYFGMREVSIEREAILINGKPIFQRLVLDQGFYPDGIWTAPTDAALKRDIELSIAAGFNGARLHQKVFEPRFLYHADRLGYIAWGEYANFNAGFGDPRLNLPVTREWIAILARDRNHPCIIGWCPFNETPPEAAELQAATVQLTRALDPSRPVLETSGWTHTIALPEVMDVHDYDGDPEALRTRYIARKSTGIPFFISEYGGIGWDIAEGSWGYGNAPKTEEEFMARYRGLAEAQLQNPRHFGLCYTQLTDVEQEMNGLYYYDRRPKFDVAKLRAIMTQPAAYEKR